MRFFLLTCFSSLAMANPLMDRFNASRSHQQLAATMKQAVDFAVQASVAQFTCLKGQGITLVFVQAYSNLGQGSFDQHAVSNIRNAQTANVGIGMEVIMSPQPLSQKTAAQQMDEMYNGLMYNGILARAVWIKIISPSMWGTNINKNLLFIAALTKQARIHGLRVGVYTSIYDYRLITNDQPMQQDVQLWYWNTSGGGSTGESPANFDDFVAFGGWGEAVVKQYGQTETLCGMTVLNKDVYMSSDPMVLAAKDSDRIEVGHIGIH